MGLAYSAICILNFKRRSQIAEFYRGLNHLIVNLIAKNSQGLQNKYLESIKKKETILIAIISVFILLDSMQSFLPTHFRIYKQLIYPELIWLYGGAMWIIMLSVIFKIYFTY